jgi:hypothetical protein
MNKIIIVSLSLLWSFTFSQVPKNEVYASYGTGSVQQLSIVFSNIIILPFIGADFTIESPIGPITAGYKRNLSEHFSIGIEGSYTQFNQEYTILQSKYKVDNTFTTVMVSSKYCYNPKNSVQFYSGLSLGGSNFNQKDSVQSANSTLFAFQLNAIGVRFGTRFAGFIELGMGYSGILNAGVSVKF